MTYLRPAGDMPGPGLDVALDFVNTTGLTGGQPFEDLASLHDALHWLVDHGVLTPEAAIEEQRRLAATPGAGEEALERIRRVRTGLRELIDAVDKERPPAEDALAAVNEALATRESTTLVPGPDGQLRLERRREGEPVDRALAELARRVAAEFGEGRPDRFRVCGNDRCRWVFYDRSRPGSRRWCEMSSCGNRAKAARHRARAKANAERAEQGDGKTAPPS
jgi:predicted RNA-binding Zn ribbon-like protein